MPPLASELRGQLERAIIAARDLAEEAATAAIGTLAVTQREAFATMTPAQRKLRAALRAKAAQLGEATIAAGGVERGLPLLIHEIAYEQWHRMLFARFLAENGLLMHPSNVAVTLQDCAELARDEGARDGWELAARYAGLMLPGLFVADDPAVQVRFAPEHRNKLETLLQALPRLVFTADDSLGWVYQFWQTKRKKAVNDSGEKIGGANLGPVTQLFTEDYMVKFLLHNSLGAWWAARQPDSPLVAGYEYLRWADEAEARGTGEEKSERGLAEEDPTLTLPKQGGDREGLAEKSGLGENYDALATRLPPQAGEGWGGVSLARTPAAGSFPGWPKRVAEVTVMDPCGGSGHFVVAAFEMLVPMRMAEEGSSEAEAVIATLADNLFMLELDDRCCQIAAFNLMLAAWKRIGYRNDLPLPNIACSGIAVEGQLSSWLKLAGDNQLLQSALTRLYELFRQAPTLGSLINPRTALQDGLFSVDYADVAPLLDQALSGEQGDDPAAAVVGQAAQGVLRAARLLAGQYTLVATNVPYLARSGQSAILRDYCETQHPVSMADLACVFLERSLQFCLNNGVSCIVIPQSILSQPAYLAARKMILRNHYILQLIRLGANAFEGISGEVVNVALISVSRTIPSSTAYISGLDVSIKANSYQKAVALRESQLLSFQQSAQINNPDSRIVLADLNRSKLLNNYASCVQGLATSDDPQFVIFFWEISTIGSDWEVLLNTVRQSMCFGGGERIIHWEDGTGRYYRHAMQLKEVGRLGGWKSGTEARGKCGVIVSQMSALPVSLYTGQFYNHNASVIVPNSEAFLSAIWAFVTSPEFNSSVRQIDHSLKPSNNTLIQIPFDLEHWQQIADEKYPDGLPEPYSNDPTQWLFNGHPVGSSEPLQVAVARLLGYHWPQQESGALKTLADEDGILCLPAVAGEQPAAERLRGLLAHAYSNPPTLPDFERYRVGEYVPTTPVPVDAGWSPATQQRLLAAVGYENKDLATWLREGFFEQHCRLFQNRPFIWHIWDGRKDGFSALVNYHKLDGPKLDKLIYTYLGAWINSQRAAMEQGEAGADGRLVAALTLKTKLEAIRLGEPPYDLYVRWKPLHQQPIGWTPDLNDGVRLNIRPWVEADVLRKKFTINWKKDRGTNPDGSERHNDKHFTREEKEAARLKITA